MNWFIGGRLGFVTIGCAASKLALWSSMLGRREKRNKEKNRKDTTTTNAWREDIEQNTIKNKDEDSRIYIIIYNNNNNRYDK